MYSQRLLTNEDYPELCIWWKWWRFAAPPIELLPDNGCGGIMISKDGVDVCAGFLYYTNSALCWIEFIISNPKYKEKDRGKAIQYLINELSGMAKAQGFKGIFTSVKNQSLLTHYEQCGYKKGVNNTHEMVLTL